MKIHIILPLFLVLFSSSAPGHGWLWPSGGGSSTPATIRQKIASKAESYVGSTRWCYACSSGHGRNTNKCNYFVYDVGNEAGAKMPTRSFWRGPVGAGVGGWGTASSLSYWKRVSSPQRGDIVAARNSNNVYHVGIYVAYRTTVSANSKDVGRKSWPYGGGYYGIVYWRYTG